MYIPYMVLSVFSLVLTAFQVSATDHHLESGYRTPPLTRSDFSPPAFNGIASPLESAAYNVRQQLGIVKTDLTFMMQRYEASGRYYAASHSTMRRAQEFLKAVEVCSEMICDYESQLNVYHNSSQSRDWNLRYAACHSSDLIEWKNELIDHFFKAQRFFKKNRFNGEYLP